MTQDIICDGLEASRPLLGFGMFENGGVFDVQSMIVMSEKSIFHGLEVPRPFQGCLYLRVFRSWIDDFDVEK